MRINPKIYPGIGSLIFCLVLFPTCKRNPENPEVPANHIHGIIPLPLSVDLSDGNLVIYKNIILVNNLQFQPAVTVVENALVHAFSGT